MRRLAHLWWLIGAVLAAGVLAGSGVLYAGELSGQQTERRAVESQTVLRLHESVDDVLSREFALGRVIAALHGRLNRRWSALAAIVTTQPAANSAGFIEPVRQQNLSRFARRTGLSLHESLVPGRVGPDTPRPLHLVVTDYLQNGSGPSPLGLDLAANPLRRTLLLSAARTNRALATEPVEFLTRPTDRRGVIVYDPVRGPRGQLFGWVTVAYDARRLTALVAPHSGSVRLSIRDEQRVLLATDQPRLGPPTTITVAGRHWTVWAGAPLTSVSSTPWLVLGFGLCLAIAVSVIVRRASTREQDAVRTLGERDAEEAALREIATLVAENASPDAVFALVAQQIGNLFEARTAAVSRFEPAQNVGTVVGGWTREGQDLAGSVFALDGVTASAEIFRTGGTVARTELAYHSQTDPIAPLMSSLSASGGIAAAIYVAGGLWGALGAAYSDQPIPVGAEVRLERFARLVGLTISNTEAWDRLARQASTDPLTGLANRRIFHERLAGELARAERHHRNLSLVLFDLDHFKRINDKHGHQAGDRVLARFAALLQASTRQDEVIARIGGEEFAWLIPETDEAGVHAAAERVRAAVETEPLAGLRLTVSAGIRFATTADDVDTLIDGADQALYRAKDRGRNTVAVDDAEACAVRT